MNKTELISKSLWCVTFLYLISNSYTTEKEIKQNFLEKEQAAIYEKIKIKKMAGKTLSYSDFEHVNAGCPENSICNKQMGIQKRHFDKFINQIKNKKRKTIIKEMNSYLLKNGIPVFYLSQQEAYDKYSPIMWNSPCENHRPNKKHQLTIFRSMSFIKGIENNKANIIYSNKNLKAQQEDTFIMDKIIDTETKIEYLLPHLTRPYYMNGENIVILQNQEDFYYAVSINPSGKWEIIDHLEETKSFYIVNEEIKCPEEEAFKDIYYQGRYCKKVYNTKTKKYNILSVPWSCI